MNFDRSTLYQAWVQRLRLPLVGRLGRRIMAGFAAVVGDATIDWATAALLEHLPELSSSDGVALTASERQIDAAPAEALDELATRLTQAVPQWRLAGSPIGILCALYFAGFPGAVLVQQNGRAYYLSAPPVLADLATLATVQPSWYVVAATGTTPVDQAGPGGMLAAGSWWMMGGPYGLDFAFASRFAVLFPGPQFPSSFTTWATATFDGSSDAVAVAWNNAFDDATYVIQSGAAIVTDGNGPVLISVDGTTKSTTGVTVNASRAFAGRVDLLAYTAGAASPFADPHAGDLARLRRVITKWRGGKATCTGIEIVAQGRCIGWPVRQIGDGSAIGPSTVVHFDP